MAKLILEFSRKKSEVQNPEAKFCYVFKNLIELRHPQFPGSIFYMKENGDILAELFQPLDEFYLTDELRQIFEVNYWKNNIASDVLSVLKIQAGQRDMKSIAWKINRAVKYLLIRHFNLKVSRACICMKFSANLLEIVAKRDPNWKAQCPGGIHAKFEL